MVTFMLDGGIATSSDYRNNVAAEVLRRRRLKRWFVALTFPWSFTQESWVLGSLRTLLLYFHFNTVKVASVLLLFTALGKA